VVVNDNGGAATADAFSFQVQQGDSTPGAPVTFTQGENPLTGKNDVVVDPGAYTVTEPTADGYTTTYDNCTDVSVSAGGTATCTITNDDIAPPPPSNPTTTSDLGRGGNGNGNPSLLGVINGGGQVLGASIGPTGQVLGTSTCAALITQIPLAQGLTNNPSQVKALQGFLNGEVNAGLPTTGFFGSLTKNAVNAFQLKYWQDVLAPWVPFGLPTDHTTTGIVGKTTAWKINEVYCPSLGLPAPTLP
jgi:hypothetical protein